jgi:hypothetical protein
MFRILHQNKIICRLRTFFGQMIDNNLKILPRQKKNTERRLLVFTLLRRIESNPIQSLTTAMEGKRPRRCSNRTPRESLFMTARARLLFWPLAKAVSIGVAFTFCASLGTASTFKEAVWLPLELPLELTLTLGVTVDAFAFSNHRPKKGKSSLHSGLVLGIDHATQLSTGTFSFPPMVSVPCGSANNDDKQPPILKEIIKPPNVETLYDSYCDQKKTPDADPSWGVLWPTAVSLSNYILSL